MADAPRTARVAPRGCACKQHPQHMPVSVILDAPHNAFSRIWCTLTQHQLSTMARTYLDLA
eukprot:9323442-Lingulodinium_polyedra.AAC.1